LGIWIFHIWRREGLGIVKEVRDLYILVGAPRIPFGKGDTIFQTFEGGPVFPLEFRRVEEREIDRGLELRREMLVHWEVFNGGIFGGAEVNQMFGHFLQIYLYSRLDELVRIASIPFIALAVGVTRAERTCVDIKVFPGWLVE
jgi:hypothetical protein